MFRKLIKTLSVIVLLLGCAELSARPSTFLPAEQEVFAIGDLHGDFNAMVTILRAAGLINSSNNWIGGSRTFIQVGDQLDRGNGEKQILDLFEKLIAQAEQAGGQVLVLNGNHETMNVELDFRYVTSGGFSQFSDHYHSGISDSAVTRLPSEQRGRAVAFKPGGPYANILSTHNATVMVGQTVFIHGGITPAYARYGLERVNDEISQWMKGYASRPSSVGGSGPLWNRDYGGTMSSATCNQLEETLAELGAKRMVVAHTVQRSINQACNGKVWRVDVGMSDYYGGQLQALKITNDSLIQIVEENGRLTETGFGNSGDGECQAIEEAPKNLVASNLKSDSLSVTWSPVDHASGYQLEYFNGNSWVSTRTSQTSHNLNNLPEGSTVKLRVKASNLCSESDYTEEVAVTLVDTGSCQAPQQVASISTSNLSTGSFSAHWPEAENATSYIPQLWVNSAWHSQPAVTTNQVSFTKLIANSTQFVRVIAVNSCNEQAVASSWVEVKLSSVEQCEAPSAPSQLSASNIGSNTYTLSWPAVTKASSYKVQRWSESNGAWQDYNTTTNTSLTVSGEQRSTAYARVIAISSCGKASNASQYLTISMASDSGVCSAAPTVPTGLKVDSGVLTWTKVAQASYYKVMGWSGSSWEFYTNATNNSLTMSSTTPQYLSVSARNDCGKSSYSSYIQVR
ncbi:fibronectin type III domain-containing protein [Agarivorans sp. DSG3-1]|uniref:fibronectin type III domain-containing protein n=1 Tax=Agarivorans sp. DSG3-1 TaxID=3342249 RepID=UPI00398F2BA3